MKAVFETELVEIVGVKPEVQPSPSAAPATTASGEMPVASHVVVEPATNAVPVAETTQGSVAQSGPMDEEKGDGECNLLGDFALLVQGALGLLAVSSLAVKRWREHPRRPVKIWFFDASKQVFGSVLLHLANVLMSMLSSGKFDVAAKTNLAESDEGDQPNPCSFYLLNLAIDVSYTHKHTVRFFANMFRPQSASPSSYSSSRSSTAAPFSPLSPTHPNPFVQETMATHPAPPGGSSNQSSTSSVCSS